MTEKWTLANSPDLTGRVMLVTGGAQGLGFEVVQQLAARNAQMIIADVDIEAAESARERILSATPTAIITSLPLDLADLASVAHFAATILRQYPRLDVLINNAGVSMVPQGRTRDGFELHMGINYLGHFALTAHLLPLIRQTAQARVIAVTSIRHASGALDQFVAQTEQSYDRGQAYANSKLACLLFSGELQRYFEQHQIDAMSLAAHPGIARTALVDHSITDSRLLRIITRLTMAIFGQDADQGALPILRAATDPHASGGELYGPHGFNGFRGKPVLVQPEGQANDHAIARQLWHRSQEMTGVTFP